MYFHTDTIYFPELPYKVGGNLHPPHKPVIRYLHVRIKDKEIVNIYDNVKIAGTGKNGVTYWYLGSVTHECCQGNIVSYFLIRIVDGKTIQYHVKNFLKQGNCFVLSYIVLAQ
jgi:hypothetical protein